MSAEISETGSRTWKITISDAPAGWSYTQSAVAHAGPAASAEWIVEAPTIGGRLAPLAHPSTTKFYLDTVNGSSPSLTQNEGGVMVKARSIISTPSGPDIGDSSSDGFSIGYGSTPPPAANS
jgi:hypothetical protein